MPKIMLVEDDKSLREIYSIRLVAEGYDVVSAGDGEEALAIAVQQKPDLILSDVMMPKISGFDMLDILRSTPETKDIKVIMMTALSSEEQRQRGESLGADKYLVKSQVGIEDVINAVHEVMKDKGDATSSDTQTSTPAGGATAAPTQEATATPSNAQVSTPIGGAVETVATTPATETQTAAADAQATTAGAATPMTETQATAEAIQPTDKNAQPADGTQPADAQATPAPQQNSTAAEMEALLSEAGGTPNANWPGTSAQ